MRCFNCLEEIKLRKTYNLTGLQDLQVWACPIVPQLLDLKHRTPCPVHTVWDNEDATKVIKGFMK